MNDRKNTVPAWLEWEQQKWRRFELIAKDRGQVEELNRVLAQRNLSRRDLAVIVASLRIRPEFSIDDFDY